MVENWEVIAYESLRGDKPVENFIYSLPKKVRSKVTHDIDLLSIHGYKLGTPHSKQLTGDIHELRIRGKLEIRIF